MKFFLSKDVWDNKRGFIFGEQVDYLKVGWHTGQDFFTNPIGSVSVLAPADGELCTFQFSKTAGWWGYFQFKYKDKIFSLKRLHMNKEMKAGKYKEGDVLGYCGATGLSSTSKYGISYIGPSDNEQNSDRAVGHLHVELHKGEFKHDTNKVKSLARERIIDPICTFESWLGYREEDDIKEERDKLVFYKEKGQSSVYIKGRDDVYYPIIMGKHFIALFGDWKKNNIVEVDKINNKSNYYFGLFNADENGRYNTM